MYTSNCTEFVPLNLLPVRNRIQTVKSDFVKDVHSMIVLKSNLLSYAENPFNRCPAFWLCFQSCIDVCPEPCENTLRNVETIFILRLRNQAAPTYIKRY